jgi:hypothetical protein
MLKKILVALVLLVAVVATVPWWGSCDLNAQACSTWCNVKHLNSDMKAAGCRASCALDGARCRGDKAAKEVSDFMSGFKGE